MNRLLAFILLGLSPLACADSRLIVLSLQRPPDDVISLVDEELWQERAEDKISQWGSIHPQKFAKRMRKSLVTQEIPITATRGIPAVYTSYCTVSNKSSLIWFPLRHTTESLTIIVTPRIDFSQLAQETFSFLFIDRNAMEKSTMIEKMSPIRYQCNKKTEGKIVTWAITQEGQSLNTALPSDAVIILANPKNIFVPSGSFQMGESPHLSPPPIYLIGTKHNDAITLSNLGVFRYFEEITEGHSMQESKDKQDITQSAILND